MKNIFYLFIFFSCNIFAQSYTIVKPSQLPAATVINPSDLFILNQGTTTKKVTYSILNSELKDTFAINRVMLDSISDLREDISIGGGAVLSGPLLKSNGAGSLIPYASRIEAPHGAFYDDIGLNNDTSLTIRVVNQTAFTPQSINGDAIRAQTVNGIGTDTRSDNNLGLNAYTINGYANAKFGYSGDSTVMLLDGTWHQYNLDSETLSTNTSGYINQNDGKGNSVLGYGAFNVNPARGTYNVAVGWQPLTSSLGSYNVAVGGQSLLTNVDGSNNVAVGTQSLATSQGSMNTAIGNYALANILDGNNNIGIGNYAGYYVTDTANTIFINSLDRINSTGDLTKSIIVAHQAADVSDQRLDLNATTKVYTLKLDTTASKPLVKGESKWNDTDKCIETYLGDGVTVQNNTEVPIYVQNNSGSQIPAGKVVYIIAAGGEVPRILLADNRYIPTAYKAIGLTTSTINHGSNGFVTTFGKVHDMNTSGMEGQYLYLTTSGNWSTTKPINAHIVQIGYVSYGHISNGIIFVNIKFETSTNFAVSNYDATSSVSLDSTNAVRLKGASTAFEDYEIDLASLKSLGAVAKPDFDLTNLTFDFPINDTTEIMGKAIETHHNWAEGDTIWFHLHYDQTQNLTPGFRIQYKIYNRGEAEPALWTRITSTGNVYSYTSGTIHNMLTFPAVIMSGKTVSCVIKVKLYRYDNTYTGDCKVTRFAYHYKIDSFGSNTTSSKN